MDDLDRILQANKAILRVRALGGETPEKAVPELRRLLSLATGDAVLAEILRVTGRFGPQAAPVLPEVRTIADGHAELHMRRLARSVAKQIRKSAETSEPS